MSKPTLTPDEEVRFDELFATSDRLSLSHDWVNVLHREIAKTHAEPGFSPAPSADVAIALLVGTNFDNVVIDENLTVWVFDDDGSEVASFDFDEVLAEVLRSPLETPTERVVSWATGPNDWRFADLDGLSTFLWDFQPLDEGLLATAADDSTEALLIEWPDGFEG